MAPGVLMTFKKQFKQQVSDYLDLQGLLSHISMERVAREIDKLESINFSIEIFKPIYKDSEQMERLFTKAYEKALAKTDNETTQKYINIAADIIENAVIATTETYVKTLKAEGKFDKEAQLKALEATKDAVLKTLSDDAKQHLMGSIGDLESYITNKIEAVIKNTK